MPFQYAPEVILRARAMPYAAVPWPSWSSFKQADRLAAATKMISNHRAVICDVTNPSKEFNVYGHR